ncbi:hypothetical protein AAA435_11485 [Lactobacillus crispatus]|uniref:hypothetical protein n=1 Tax=Lactobacillus crispatus TaxID=47770 RepID=UPI0030F5AD44
MLEKQTNVSYREAKNNRTYMWDESWDYVVNRLRSASLDEVVVRPSDFTTWIKTIFQIKNGKEVPKEYTAHELNVITAYGIINAFGYKNYRIADIAKVLCFATGDPSSKEIFALPSSIQRYLKEKYPQYARKDDKGNDVTIRAGFLKILHHFLPKMTTGTINSETNPVANLDQVLDFNEMRDLNWKNMNEFIPILRSQGINFERHQILGWLNKNLDAIDQHYYYQRRTIYLDDFALQVVIGHFKAKNRTKFENNGQPDLLSSTVEEPKEANVPVRSFTPISFISRELNVDVKEIENFINLSLSKSDSPLRDHWILNNNGERMIDAEGREIIAEHFKQVVSTKQVTPLDDAVTASLLGEENTEGDEKKPQDYTLVIKTLDNHTLLTTQFKSYEEAQEYLFGDGNLIKAFEEQDGEKKVPHIISTKNIMDVYPAK